MTATDPKQPVDICFLLAPNGSSTAPNTDKEIRLIAFNIGGKDAEFVRISITGDHKDGWLSADVKVAAGKFAAIYPASFDTFAFSEFAKQLRVLHRTVSGSAEFTSLEGQLELTLKCDALGHVTVDGTAMDVAGIGNRLMFKLEIDQTHLPGILKSLKSMLKKHPVRKF